jgi:predicted Zn-dependent peptidase
MQFDDNFDKVTAEDIMRVARKYFVETNRTVGVFIPTNSETVQS